MRHAASPGHALEADLHLVHRALAVLRSRSETERAAVSLSASAASRKGKVCETCGLSLPSRYQRSSWRQLSANCFGSRREKSPQKTPTTEAPLRSGRLSGNLGMSPAAKPTTSR